MENAAYGSTVKLHDGLHQLQGCRMDGGLRSLLQNFHQLLDLFCSRLKLTFLCHSTPLTARCLLTACYAEHGRVARFEHLSVAQVHVHTTRKAGIETSHRPHNVNTFELFRTILFKDQRY